MVCKYTQVIQRKKKSFTKFSNSPSPTVFSPDLGPKSVPNLELACIKDRRRSLVPPWTSIMALSSTLQVALKPHQVSPGLSPHYVDS